MLRLGVETPAREPNGTRGVDARSNQMRGGVLGQVFAERFGAPMPFVGIIETLAEIEHLGIDRRSMDACLLQTRRVTAFVQKPQSFANCTGGVLQLPPRTVKVGPVDGCTDTQIVPPGRIRFQVDPRQTVLMLPLVLVFQAERDSTRGEV